MNNSNIINFQRKVDYIPNDFPKEFYGQKTEYNFGNTRSPPLSEKMDRIQKNYRFGKSQEPIDVNNIDTYNHYNNNTYFHNNNLLEDYKNFNKYMDNYINKNNYNERNNLNNDDEEERKSVTKYDTNYNETNNNNLYIPKKLKKINNNKILSKSNERQKKVNNDSDISNPYLNKIKAKKIFEQNLSPQNEINRSHDLNNDIIRAKIKRNYNMNYLRKDNSINNSIYQDISCDMKLNYKNKNENETMLNKTNDIIIKRNNTELNPRNTYDYKTNDILPIYKKKIKITQAKSKIFMNKAAPNNIRNKMIKLNCINKTAEQLLSPNFEKNSKNINFNVKENLDKIAISHLNNVANVNVNNLRSAYTEPRREINNNLNNIEKSKKGNKIQELTVNLSTNDKNLSNNNNNINHLNVINNNHNNNENENNISKKNEKNVNNKDNILIKELEEEKNKNISLKEQDEEKDTKINQLNEKMSKLFSEIANKDKIINQHNQEHIQMSKNLNDINDSKNNLINKISEKEKEILDLQKSNDEINNKFLNINEQNNSLLNECQNKSNEINNLNETIKNNNNLLKLKDESIYKLNKKLKSQKNQILYMNFKKNNKNVISLAPLILPTNTNCKNSEFFDTKFEIDSLKDRNNNLFSEKLITNENQNKLNMKYNVTKVLMNLGPQLTKEFSEYKSKNKKAELNLNELIDNFINEKKEKCNQEINNTQNNINQKIIEKKKINGQLLNEVKKYNEIFTNKFNQYLSNLNELVEIFKEKEKNINDDNKSRIQIIQEIIEEVNQCNLYEANLGKINGDNNEAININELKEMINKLKGYTINKKDIIINLIPKIIESYNIIIKEEMNADNQIKYYQYKKQILIDKKTTNDDLDKFISEYSSLKDTILSFKEQYKKIKEDFLLSKENLIYNENIYTNQIEKELLNNTNIENGEDKNSVNLNHSSEETNDEDDEDNQKIMNEISTLKSNILNKKNILKEILQNEDNKNENEIYNKCKNADFNLSKQEKKIKTLITSRDNIEKKLDDLKLNFLLLNTLPNQYQTYKVFISHDVIKEYNKKLEQKLKLVFGNNFNVNYIYIDEKPEVIWRQDEISKLKSDIMILREEKNNLENDLSALRAAFDLALKSNGSDSPLIILFKIKEENKKLKKEIQQIKEKNIKLEEKLKELNYNNNIEIINSNNKNFKINDFMGMNNSLNGNSILSINDIGVNNNNHHNNNKVIRDLQNNNLKQTLLYSDSKFNSSFLNGSKECSSEYKSKKKFNNYEK